MSHTKAAWNPTAVAFVAEQIQEHTFVRFWHCRQSEQPNGKQKRRFANIKDRFEMTENLEEIWPRPNNDQDQPKSTKTKSMSIRENPFKSIKIMFHQSSSKTIGSQFQNDLLLSAPVPGWSGLFPERCLAIAPTSAICQEWKKWKKHRLSQTNAPKKM